VRGVWKTEEKKLVAAEEIGPAFLPLEVNQAIPQASFRVGAKGVRKLWSQRLPLCAVE
jgi:hypothetical protein